MIGSATARRYKFATPRSRHVPTRVKTNHTDGVRGDVGNLVLFWSMIEAEAVHVVAEDEEMFTRLSAQSSTGEMIILLAGFSATKIQL